MAEASNFHADGIISGMPIDETNFLRIIYLLLKVAPRAVQVKFDKEFNPDVLDKELQKAKWTVIEQLKKKRIITQAQWILLFPDTGKANSSTFDISLMVCLIRNLTHITVGEKLPLQTDTSEGADLSRMKYYRNKLVHSEKVAFSDKPFQEYWTDISEAIIRLGGPKFKLICREIEARQLGDDDKKLLTEIRNISRSYDPIPKGMRVINDQKVGEWEMENVIETRAIKQMCKLVETEHVVVAVGPSGCGKSTAIRRVAVKLLRKCKFSIVPVYSAQQIVELYNPYRQQVFVIDDLCGKATIDTDKVNKWYDLSNDITQILNNSPGRILASCRTHIFQDRLFKPITLLRKATCDFLSGEYCLTIKERENIANIYLKQEETSHLLKCPERLNFEFFPLLCCLYSQNRTGQIIDFFTNPTQVIRDELNLLWEAADQKTFGTLILFIVYDNFLPIALLNKTSGIKSILEEISDGLHLKSVFTIKAVMSELANLQNSYVKKHEKGYSIIHDKVFDILVCFFGEHDFELTIDIAHTDVIRDRFVMTSLSEKDSNSTHENVLVIPVEKEETYFDRLFRDVNEGFLENIFLNKNLSCATYRQKLIQHFKGTSDFCALLRQMSCEKTYILVLSMLHKGFCDIVPLLITEHVNLNINHKISETPLFLAVNEGYTDIVDLFLKNNADPNISSWYTSRPMHRSLLGVHNSVANVGRTFEKLSLPNNQRVYCKSDREDVQFSFKKHDTNKVYRKTPLYIAALKGFTSIAEMLLKHQADPNLENGCDNVTPLYIATVKGYTEIVSLLLKFKAKPNFCDKFNRTPLYIAAEEGHYDIVKVLLENNGDPNTSSNWFDSSRDKKTPIQIASEKGNENIVTLLLKYKADPNIRDKFNKTALYLASAEHHTAIVNILLQHGAKPNIVCFVDNNSPIAIASERGYDDIVKLLKESVGHHSFP